MIALLLSTLLACGTKDPEPECYDNGGCPTGAACQAGVCTDVECLSSSDCALNFTCNESYACVEGCTTDVDCQAGASCDKDVGLCLPDACTNTDIDCGYGQFCDTTSGECGSGGKDWCATCDRSNPRSCGGSTSCFAFVDPSQGYCWNACQQDTDCPRGFTCTDQELDPEGPPKVCLANCAWIVANGYL